jgi:AcrR family transcriptional regulator
MSRRAKTIGRRLRGPRKRGGDPIDRRDQIRRVAADLFFEKGYESTTIRDIAAILKIKAASLYYHFPDKEQILFEVIDSVVNQLLDGCRYAVAQEHTAELKLAALVVNHVVLHALRPRESTLGDTELRSLTAARLKQHVQHRDDYDKLILHVLRQGEKERRFNLLDTKLTAYALAAQSTQVGKWFRQPGRLSLSEVAEAHVEFAMRMVKAAAVKRSEVERLATTIEQLHVSFNLVAGTQPVAAPVGNHQRARATSGSLVLKKSAGNADYCAGEGGRRSL